MNELNNLINSIVPGAAAAPPKATVWENVVSSLDIMWKGMLGLFAVCALVALITNIIGKVARSRDGAGKSAAV
jgi:hypothetical protein